MAHDDDGGQLLHVDAGVCAITIGAACRLPVTTTVSSLTMGWADAAWRA